MSLLFAGLVLMTSCQKGDIEHIGETRLVMLQPIPMIDHKFDENFRATLELLYPHECHDTVFIQEQIFLERIDLPVPVKREFVIPPKLWRDFFGSNNPDAKRALREDLFYFSDSSFEKNPDRQFLLDSTANGKDQSKVIGDYLLRNRKNSLVFLISNDTLCKKFAIGGVFKDVHNNFAKLNCLIVSELRKKPREELRNTTVILMVIPPARMDTASNHIKIRNPLIYPGTLHGKGATCPPDSVVNTINKHHQAVIREFRNLLHYIATTSTDDTLKKMYREDAWSEIHKIPGVKIEGIPGNDLHKFLNSGFSKNIIILPVNDQCKVITGILISEH